MTHKLPSEQEMTDVFGRFENPLPPVGETPGPRISNRKKALLGTAAVLLGSGAAFAAINFDKISALIEDEKAPTDGGPPETDTNGVPGETAPNDTPVRHHTASDVHNGTITPNENIAIAGQVEEQMTFGQAYAAAREETGPGGIFSWHGKVYNTYTLEEWQGMSFGQRQEFLSDVGYRPTQSTERTSGTGAGVGRTPFDPPHVEPAYIELVINGRPALGIDDDHDGIADAIVFMDEESNDLLVLMDVEGDDRIDAAIQFDPFSHQIVNQQAIEQPFLAEMSQLEAMSGVTDEPMFSYAGLAGDSEGTFNDDDNDYTDDDGYVNDAELPEMD